MELYDKALRIIDVNLVYCLFPLTLTIILIELIFRHRFKTKKILNLIRWFIISYTSVTLIHHLIGILTVPDKFEFLNRATGPYKLIFWLMFISASILPFSLFYKKMAERSLYILLLTVLMKIGVYFEIYVIIATNYHSDFIPFSKIDSSSQVTAIEIFFLQGFIIGVILIGLFELLERKKNCVQQRF